MPSLAPCLLSLLRSFSLSLSPFYSFSLSLSLSLLSLSSFLSLPLSLFCPLSFSLFLNHVIAKEGRASLIAAIFWSRPAFLPRKRRREKFLFCDSSLSFFLFLLTYLSFERSPCQNYLNLSAAI